MRSKRGLGGGVPADSLELGYPKGLLFELLSMQVLPFEKEPGGPYRGEKLSWLGFRNDIFDRLGGTNIGWKSHRNLNTNLDGP